jgi:hypothetical protein
MAAASLLALLPAAGKAEIAYAVDSSAILISFDTERPDPVLTMGIIRGLQPGERILGIDFRPVDGKLYGLGSTSRLYTIDLRSAIATVVGEGPFTPALDGESFGFDFNPTVDRIRIVSNTGQNLRAHPVTGLVVATDGMLQYAAAEGMPMTAPNAVASAYTNSVFGARSTTLYNVDLASNSLVSQNPPNNGTLNRIGSLAGLNLSTVAGFDISPDTNTAYVVVRSSRTPNSELYQVDLRTAATTRMGQVGWFEQVGSLAIAPARVLPSN